MLRRLFTAHPATCGETYGQHARFAFGVSLQLFGAAAAAMIHALVPAFFETTASRTVKRLYPRMVNRGVQSEAPAE